MGAAESAAWAGAIAGFVAAGASWAGVIFAWRFAGKSDRAQKDALKHAEDAQKAALSHEERLRKEDREHAERLQREDREHAEKLQKEAREQEGAARRAELRAEQNAKAHGLFVSICNLPKVDTRGSHHPEANEKADELYALLGNSPRSRYVVTTAMAFFSYGNDEGLDRVRESKLKEERDTVERYLTGLDPMLNIPATGAVRDWAKPPPPGVGLSPGLRGKLWLLKPDD